MATLDDFNAWFARDMAPLCRSRRWKYEVVPSDDSNATYRVTTGQYIFTINADASLDYLHGECETLGNAPGKHHPQFAGLPDGKLTEETWQAIVADIKQWEAQPKRFRGPA
jgi:hypothetical protein